MQRCRGAEVQVKCRGAVKQRFRGAEVPKLSRGDCADDCAGAEAVQRSRGGAEQMWRRCRGAGGAELQVQGAEMQILRF